MAFAAGFLIAAAPKPFSLQPRSGGASPTGLFCAAALNTAKLSMHRRKAACETYHTSPPKGTPVSNPRTVFACVIAFATPAFAEPQCAPLPDALTGLATNYGEEPRVTALMTGGNMLVITAAPAGGWTALEVRPDGAACIVAAGEGFGVVDAKPQGDPT